MPCQQVHDWPWLSDGVGYECRACGAFLTDEAVRAYYPEGDGSPLSRYVLDEAYAVQQASVRDVLL